MQKLSVRSNISGVFYHRLVFAIRFARFQELLQRDDLADAAGDLVSIIQEDLAPSAWWAVVLCDAMPLLDYGQSYTR